jgi:hypothetical protein
VKPGIDHVLRTAAAQLLAEIAPRIADEHAQTTAGMIAALLGIGADEYDRAAHVRHAENEDFRALFRAAAARVDAPELGRRLAEAGGTRDESLRVGDLERANAELRRLLIELHEHAERQPGGEGRRLEAEIWQALRRSAERRTLAPGAS